MYMLCSSSLNENLTLLYSTLRNQNGHLSTVKIWLDDQGRSSLTHQQVSFSDEEPVTIQCTSVHVIDIIFKLTFTEFNGTGHTVHH